MTANVLMFKKLNLKRLNGKESTLVTTMSRPSYWQKKFKSIKNFGARTTIWPCNFGSAMAHARSIAAKVLMDGENPFIF